jgi:glycosyltransferase involved in cell wall biosynthesis
MLQAQHFDVVFFEALEDHFDAFVQARQWLSGTKIVGISHQPPAWWRMYGVTTNVYAAVDSVITLSQQAEGYLKLQLGHANVHLVPHGVDVDFFMPGSPQSIPTEGPVEVLFCGQWLRDFRQLTDTLAVLARTPQNFVFHLVVPTFARDFEQHYRLARHDNVHWYAGLTDEALRGLYQRAHLMFLPLIDATANNSLLEAMASGLPIVVSKIGGVCDYVEEGGGVFLTAEDGVHAAERLTWCVAHYEDCLAMAQRSRSRAVTVLSWDVVAARLVELLREA